MKISTRNKRIYELHKTGATYKELARRYNLSEARISQIICAQKPTQIDVTFFDNEIDEHRGNDWGGTLTVFIISLMVAAVVILMVSFVNNSMV